MSDSFPIAPVSYVVSLSFQKELSNTLITLNHSLTQVFGEGSYALNDWWAPHLTLFQGGTDKEGMIELINTLDGVLSKSIGATITFTKLHCEESGLLLLEPEATEELLTLEKDVSNICAKLHMSRPLYRPRAIAKLQGLDEEAQEIMMTTGSYKTGSLFRPHILIAQFREVESSKILKQALPLLNLPLTAKVASASLLDAGHSNEKGDVRRLWDAM